MSWFNKKAAQLYPTPDQVERAKELKSPLLFNALADLEGKFEGIITTNSSILAAFLVRMEGIEQSQSTLLAAINDLTARRTCCAEGAPCKILAAIHEHAALLGIGMNGNVNAIGQSLLSEIRKNHSRILERFPAPKVRTTVNPLRVREKANPLHGTPQRKKR